MAKGKPNIRNIRQGQTVYLVCMDGEGVRKWAVLSNAHKISRFDYWAGWGIRKKILLGMIDEFGNQDLFFSKNKAEKRALSLRFHKTREKAFKNAKGK